MVKETSNTTFNAEITIQAVHDAATEAAIKLIHDAAAEAAIVVAEAAKNAASEALSKQSEAADAVAIAAKTANALVMNKNDGFMKQLQRAQGNIEKHEAVCAERMIRIDETLRRLELYHTEAGLNLSNFKTETAKQFEVAAKARDDLRDTVESRFSSLNKIAWTVIGTVAVLVITIAAGILFPGNVPHFTPPGH